MIYILLNYYQELIQSLFYDLVSPPFVCTDLLTLAILLTKSERKLFRLFRPVSQRHTHHPCELSSPVSDFILEAAHAFL